MVYRRLLPFKARKVAALRRSIAARRIQRAFRARRAAPKRSMLSAMIKKQISRTAEKKIATSAVTNYSLSYTKDAALDFQVFSIGIGDVTGFQIVQGVMQHQRIGNQIRVKKATMRMVINAMPYALGLNDFPVPFYLRMFICYDKQNKNNAPTPGAFQDWYQSGASTFAFSGTARDLTYELNRDKYCVLWQKTLKMGFSQTFLAQNQQTSNQSEDFGASNPNFKPYQIVKVNYTKYLPKLVKYNDSNSNDPSTRGLFLFMYCVRADGDPLPAGNPNTQYPCRFSYNNTLEFIDV